MGEEDEEVEETSNAGGQVGVGEEHRDQETGGGRRQGGEVHIQASS